MADRQIARVLVTGVAGFIGFHVAKALLDRGIGVTGVDNLNDYYSVVLKQARLDQLKGRLGFSFHTGDIADHAALAAVSGVNDVEAVAHLAAQAGVRYSLDHPFAYASSNLVGHLSVLELTRRLPKLKRLVYASSSSVYGANTKVPFSETDPVTQPVSLYAATKRAGELMSETYARLYGIPQIGLRFFTVYGPWGRPDMAYWKFADAILSGRPIHVFNGGDMMRDFTYIDDVVAGVLSTLLEAPRIASDAIHRIYNIGNNKPERLTRFIEILETAIGRKAERILEPMQPGDVKATYADIDAIAADYGFRPTTPLDVGLPLFVEWFKKYHANHGKL